MKTFEQAVITESDINQHLTVLLKYSLQSDSVVEIGLGRTSNAVRAFIKGCLNVISYDIDPMPEVVEDVRQYANHIGCYWQFRLQDSTIEPIPECDFLFIDGEHSYYAVSKELKMHSPNVRKFIGFHDVVSYANRNESPYETGSRFIEGIVPAIFEFLQDNPQWKVDYYSPLNNGLLILKNEIIR
jgi:hypothetical protein